MIRSKYINCIVAILMTAAVIFTTLSIGYHRTASTNSKNKNLQALEYVDNLFNKDKIMTINIKADQSDFDNMLKNAIQEKYIKCNVTINGKTYYNVGIRPKGNSSLNTIANSSDTDRFSFKFEFDHYVKGQTCQGLDKMVVNNIQADATYMKEYLSYDLMAYMGIAAPLYSYASININGKLWGFYLAVESMEESYALRNFGADYGKLYKPESMDMGDNGAAKGIVQENQQNQPNSPNQQNSNVNKKQGQSPMDTMNKQGGGSDLKYIDDNIDSYSAIFDNSVFKTSKSDKKKVIEAIKNLNEGKELEKYINVDETLRYFAVNTFLVNLDSYVSNLKHNYYLYEKDGQLSILPWDFNLAFAGFQINNAVDAVNFPIDTPVSGTELSQRPLLAKLLEIPEYKEKYHEYLNQIVNGYVNGGIFKNSVYKLDALINKYVKNDASAFYTYNQYKASLPVLKEFVGLRAKSITEQLKGTVPSTTTGQNINPNSLIKASGLYLKTMGQMNTGNGTKGEMQGKGQIQGLDNMQNMGNIDMSKMMQVMDIITSAKGELTTEQKAQLKKLGLTEEQITQLKSMSQNGRPTPSDKDGNFNPPQGNMQGQIPGNMQVPKNSTASNSTTSLPIITAISFCASLAGLGFVISFKRKKYKSNHI